MSDDLLEMPAPMAIAQPGLALRMNAPLGEQGQVIQIEAYIDRDANQKEINHLGDKMLRTAERLRARTTLPILRRQREEVEYRHNDNCRRLAELEAGLKESQRQRAEAIQRLEVRVAAIVANARNANEASGRREFKEPATLARKEKADIETLQANEVKERNEAAVQRETLENEIKDGDRALQKHDILIAELELAAANAE